jgi:ribosomal protein S18 acetylase RimI-like enzyme
LQERSRLIAPFLFAALFQMPDLLNPESMFYIGGRGRAKFPARLKRERMSADSSPAVTLRTVVKDDEPFLLEVYKSTRPEIAALGWPLAQQEAFLQMQFDGQQRSYQMQYPDAAHQIILFKDEKVGRLITFRTEREIRLADVALLPQYRNQGVGAFVVRELCMEAARRNVPVRLQVSEFNPAIRLYERLGFKMLGESDTHFQMEWRPDQTEAGNNQ